METHLSDLTVSLRRRRRGNERKARISEIPGAGKGLKGSQAQQSTQPEARANAEAKANATAKLRFGFGFEFKVRVWRLG